VILTIIQKTGYDMHCTSKTMDQWQQRKTETEILMQLLLEQVYELKSVFKEARRYLKLYFSFVRQPKKVKNNYLRMYRKY